MIWVKCLKHKEDSFLLPLKSHHLMAFFYIGYRIGYRIKDRVKGYHRTK